MLNFVSKFMDLFCKFALAPLNPAPIVEHMTWTPTIRAHLQRQADDGCVTSHDNWELHFLHCRLINTAQIVQIHTLEWTGAILNTDFIHESQIGQWNGTLSGKVKDILKKMNVTLGKGSIPTHRGNLPDYRGVPFSLTEEFVSVYRMHSLLPDIISLRCMGKG